MAEPPSPSPPRSEPPPRPPAVEGRLLTNPETGKDFRLYVWDTTDGRGKGLFTAEHLEVVTSPLAVAIYGGVYLTDDEADELYRANKKDRYLYLHAVASERLPLKFQHETWHLDGTRRRDPNLAIYCNEPNERQLVNASIGYNARNPRDPALYLYVIRSIPAGGELLVDYGDEYDRTYAGYGPSTGYVPWHERDCESRLQETLRQQIALIRSTPEQRAQQRARAEPDYVAFWTQYTLAPVQFRYPPFDIPEVPPPAKRLAYFQDERERLDALERELVLRLMNRQQISETDARAQVQDELEPDRLYLEKRTEKARADLQRETTTTEDDPPPRKTKRPKGISCYLHYRHHHHRYRHYY